MPFRYAFILLLTCAVASLGADLRTLDGKSLSGDLVRMNDKEVVLRSGDEEIATPIQQVLTIDLKAESLLPKNATYRDIELTDGTLLHCKEVKFEGRQVEMTTVAGQQVRLPLSAVSWMIGDAHDPKIGQAMKDRFLAKRRNRDVLIVKRDGQLDGLDGTFGEPDEKGENIPFERVGTNQAVPLPLTRVQGMVFLRTPDATAPEPVCKLLDNYRNTVIVSGLSLEPGGGLTVTTPSGAKLEYAPKLVAKLDFSKGKLTFLSDLEPARKIETNNLERVEHYRRDTNLDGDKLSLEGKKYDKGLALHAYTELEYKLDGEYQYFSAVMGVDDLVGGSDGPTLVKLEGDGREIKTWTVTRKDKPMPVKVPIRDVKSLRIVVSSGDLLDLGKHVNLADAKVSK